MSRPVIAITMGDAAGVGPEIIMKALTQEALYERSCPVVVGDAARLRLAGQITGAPLEVRAVLNPAKGFPTWHRQLHRSRSYPGGPALGPAVAGLW